MRHGSLLRLFSHQECLRAVFLTHSWLLSSPSSRGDLISHTVLGSHCPNVLRVVLLHHGLPATVLSRAMLFLDPSVCRAYCLCCGRKSTWCKPLTFSHHLSRPTPSPRVPQAFSLLEHPAPIFQKCPLRLLPFSILQIWAPPFAHTSFFSL